MPLETPLSDLHKIAHAQMGEYFGTILPSRFGEVSDEYKIARDAVALVDTNFNALYSFSAPDAQRYLNAVLTSNVRDLQTGQGVVGLLLTPQGHILDEIETFSATGGFLTISHAMVRDQTFSTFDKFIIMDDVILEDRTASYGTLELVGPRAASMILELSGTDIAASVELTIAEAMFGSIPCRIVRRTIFGHPAATLITGRDQLASLWRRLQSEAQKRGGATVGMEAINAIRLESGIPWFGHDFDDKQIPHEAGLEHSHISYEKGCYTGQEIVERVRSRGHVNRRLAVLQFPAGTSIAPATKLFAENTAVGAAPTEAGVVTSVAFSPLLGRPIGMGYLRKEYSGIGTMLDASGTSAEVISPPSARQKASA